MIGKISGNIGNISLTRALVEVGGVGFIVNATAAYLSKLHTGARATFWTHTAVRETDISLYGFETEEELLMFEKLLGVSGIGPKSALAILSVAGLEALEDAIISGNTGILTKIAGIGKKTVDKIILELSGKISSNREMNKDMKDDLDVFEALKALGYRDHQIQETLKEMPVETVGANDKIKLALKLLSKK
jgi:holliday junction DNA helicase RuvA